MPFGAGIFLVALAVRLIPVLLTRSLGIGLDDMFQYDMLARSLAEGNGFRWYAQPDLDLIRRYIPIDISSIAYDPRGVETSFRGPMYPLFLAAVYTVSGLADRFFAARLVQAFLSALLAPMALALGRGLDPAHERTGVIAAWITAFYPMLLLYPLAIATENLFFVLTLGAFLLLLRAVEKGNLVWFALAGVVIGAAILTRSVVALFVPLAAWWAWRSARHFRSAAVFCIAAALVVAPWCVRNSLLAGKPELVESSMGYNLYLGYHPQGNGSFQFGISLDLLTVLDDFERDRIGTQKALAFIRADPGRVPVLIVQKAGFFFGLETREMEYFYSNNLLGYLPPGVLVAAALILFLPFALLSLLAVFGAPAAPPSPAKVLVFLFLLAYITPHLLILSDERFHMVLIPILAALAAAALVNRREIRQQFRSPQGWKLWILPMVLCALLLFNWGAQLAADSPRLAVLLGPAGNTSSFPY